MSHTIDIPDDIARTVVTPRAYAEDAPVHDAFRWLRTNQPLGKARLEGIYPFWIVCKHADILEVSRQNDLFHSGDMPRRSLASRATQPSASSPVAARTSCGPWSRWMRPTIPNTGS